MSLESLEIKVAQLEQELNQIKNGSKTANQLLDTTTPSHIIVHDGNDFKKVSGIPVMVEETADGFILKMPNGTLISEEVKD